MNEQKTSKKKLGILIGIIAGVLVASGVAAAIVLPKVLKPAEPGTTNEPVVESETETEPETYAEPVGEYEIVYNVDRDEYILKSETGLTTRTADKQDGFFHVRFATETGRLVERRVKEREVVQRIDSLRLMALVYDENNVVIDCIDARKVTGGYIAERYYVMETEGQKALVNSSLTFRGDELELTWDSDTRIFDVSGHETDPGTVVNSLRADDRIIGILSEDKKRVTHIYVIERTDDTPTYTAYCEHCKEEVKWKGWGSDKTVPYQPSRYSHYYLTKDVQLLQQASMEADTKICLDLNGHKVYGGLNKRIYSLHYEGAELAIFDSSEEKTGALIATGSEVAEGLCVWTRYGTFSLYGGTLDASGFTCMYYGTTVAVPKGTTFNMYGGTLIGGTAEATRVTNADGTTRIRGGLSGTLHVSGTFNMYGGLIKDGVVKEVHYKDANGKEVTANGYGGNIYVGPTGKVHLYAGTIENGSSFRNGGNITMEKGSEVIMEEGVTIRGGMNRSSDYNGGSISIGTGSTFIMNGGTITGGTTSNCGGNVYINGTFIMNGGTVKDGVCLKNGQPNPDAVSKNLFCVHGTMRLNGGTVEGSVWIAKTDELSDVTLSGNIKIFGAPKDQSNLYISSERYFKVENLTAGAKIGITAYGIFTEDTNVAANKGYFVSDIEGASVIAVGQKLALGQSHCVCGDGTAAHGHDVQVFRAWTSETSLPSEEGYYFLTKDVQLKYQCSMKKDAKVVLCLNGHTVKGGDGQRIYSVHNEGGALTITDCQRKPGQLIAKGTNADEGQCVWVRYGSFEAYRVTFDGSGVVSNKNGAVISVPSGRTCRLYGVTVLGGTAEGIATVKSDKTYSLLGGIGGSIFAGGTVELIDSLVKNGKAKSVTYTENGVSKTTLGFGGNIYVGPSGTLILDHSTVENGEAALSGGNISTETGTSRSSEVIMKNGSIIRGGKNLGADRNGGNIYVVKNARFTMDSGELSGGSTTNCGGNLMSYGGIIEITGGVIKGGKTFGTTAMAARSYNVFLNGGSFTMTGGEVEGGLNLVVVDNAVASVDLSGKTKIAGQDVNLYIPAGYKVRIHDLSEGAEISVTADGIFTEETSEANLPYVKADNGDTVSIDRKPVGRLSIGKLMCECGGVLEGRTMNGAVHHCADHLEVFGAWKTADALPTAAGRYYLTTDVTLSATQYVASNARVVLSLNGHQVTGPNGARVYSLFYEGGELVITDDQATPGKITARGSGTDEGQCVWLRYGTFTLYNGTLDASNVVANKDGAAISIPAGRTFTMYGGTIVGGTAQAATYTKTDGTTGARGGIGGAIYVNGRADLFGGVIRDGKALSVTYNDNGTQRTTLGYGGNIYVGPSGDLTIDGTVIQNGTASQGGGNISTETGSSRSATVVLRSGAVTGGTITAADKNGGSIYIAERVAFTMSGGTVSGGVTTNCGGNITNYGGVFTMSGGTIENGSSTGTNFYAARSGNIFSNGGSFTMTGGTVAGNFVLVPVNNAITATDLSGTAKITGAATNLYIPSGLKIRIHDLASGAALSVSASGVFTETTKEANLAYVKSDAAGESVILEAYPEGGMMAGKFLRACICGGTLEGKTVGTEVHHCSLMTFREWTSSTTLPTSTGNYYLASDVQLSSQAGVSAAADIVLNLNGHTVKSGSGARIYMLNHASAVVTITDSAGNGKLVSTVASSFNADGGMFCVTNGTLNLYAATVQPGGFTNNNSGGVLYAYRNGKFNFYSGLISGGRTNKNGGNILVGGQFTMYGGIIENGQSLSSSEGGGNVCVDSSGTFTMYAGQIRGGRAVQGANIRAYGKVYLKGGEITGGTCTQNGGGLFMGSYQGNDLEISGKVIFSENKWLSSDGTRTIPNNCYLNSSRSVTFTNLSSESRIGVTWSNATPYTFAENVLAGYENSVIYADQSDKYEVTNEGGALSFRAK